MASNPSLNTFVDAFAEALREGYHFVPFLGAGFSQEAGFPTTPQLRDHLLPYWILRALELNPFAESPSELYQLPLTNWSPVDAWWPSPGDEILGLKAKGLDSPLFNLRQAQWVILHTLYDLWKWEKHGGDEGHIAPDTLKQAAELLCGAAWIGEKNREWDCKCRNEKFVPNPKIPEPSCADWLKLIHFLSRISRRTQIESKVHVGPPRQSVVDSLFMHLDAQCRPGLAQMMLAALTNICRIRTILTTNFDTLVERAFEEYRKAMEVFEVPRSAPLPNNRLVLAQPSIVKLHGGRFDVRADLTVGSPLDRVDFMNAVSYVAGRTLFKNGDIGQIRQHPGKAALLFMGCGDEDERTRDFAQYVARHLAETKVFWVSLSEKDPSKISVLGLFAKAQKYVCSYPEFGTQLLLLYQRITGSIPPTGAIFPGPWQLISPPRIPRREPDPYEAPRNDAEDKLRKSISRRMKACYHQKELPHPGIVDSSTPPSLAKPLHLVLRDGDYAAAGICVPLFHDLGFQREQKCRMLWIDLHDITMPAGVFTRLVMILARLQGVFDPLTTLHLDSLRSRGAEFERLKLVLRQTLIRHYANTGLALVVVLSGQELPGEYGMYQLDSEKRSGNANRWVTTKLEYELMWEVICDLNSCAACATQFVIVAPDSYPVSGHMACFVPPNQVEDIRYGTNPNDKATGFDPSKSALRALEWLDQVPSERTLRTAFLMAILCVRHSSYPSEIARILSELVSQEEFGRSEEHKIFETITGTSGWLEELDRDRVLRIRDGGFVWMNCQVARKLQEGELWIKASDRRLSIRALLGRWYGRLLFSCLDPLAAIEGIFQNVTGVRESIPLLDQRHFKMVAMIDNGLMLLDASRRLFEVRLTSTFADRSLAVSKELVEAVIARLDAVHKDNPNAVLLRLRLEVLANELGDLRAKVSIREGRFLDIVLPTRGAYSSSVDAIIVHGAAWLHLRRYSKAISILGPAWEKLTGLSENLWNSTGDVGSPADAVDAAQEFSATKCSGQEINPADSTFGMATKRDAIRFARWGLYLHLNSSQVHWVCEEASARSINVTGEASVDFMAIHKQSLETRRLALKHALWFYHFGVELLRSSTRTGDGFAFDEGVRFRAHGALALALLEATNERASSALLGATCWGARRMLRDAESFLGDYPIRDAGVAEAMLKLRAAEVELIEVMSIRPFEVARSIVRRTSERNLVSLGYGDTEHGSVRKAFEKALKETRYEGKMFTAEEWTICARRVGDSLVELDNAESVLSQHPKSRWWWWIFAVLKSRAVEYLYTLRYIRAIGSNEGYGAAPHIIPPSAFRFAENGLIRVVLEKDLGDIFYLARVISSLTTIIRMDYSHATLRSEPGKKFMESWCKSVRQRIGLNVAALSELVNRLDQLLLESAALHPDSHHDVISYAQTSRARADKLLKAWELLPR